MKKSRNDFHVMPYQNKIFELDKNCKEAKLLESSYEISYLACAH